MQIIDDINNDKYKIRYIWYGDYITIYVNEEEVISLNVKKYKDENVATKEIIEALTHKISKDYEDDRDNR